MKLHELQPATEFHVKCNRVDRGASSGNGKLSGRGQGRKLAALAVARLELDKLHCSVVFKTMVTNINAKEYAV